MKIKYLVKFVFWIVGIVLWGGCTSSKKSSCVITIGSRATTAYDDTYPFPCLCKVCDDAEKAVKCKLANVHICYKIISESHPNLNNGIPYYVWDACYKESQCDFNLLNDKCYYYADRYGTPLKGGRGRELELRKKSNPGGSFGVLPQYAIEIDNDYANLRNKFIDGSDVSCESFAKSGPIEEAPDEFPFYSNIGCLNYTNVRTETETKVEEICTNSNKYFISSLTNTRPMYVRCDISSFSESTQYALILIKNNQYMDGVKIVRKSLNRNRIKYYNQKPTYLESVVTLILREPGEHTFALATYTGVNLPSNLSSFNIIKTGDNTIQVLNNQLFNTYNSTITSFSERYFNIVSLYGNDSYNFGNFSIGNSSFTDILKKAFWDDNNNKTTDAQIYPNLTQKKLSTDFIDADGNIILDAQLLDDKFNLNTFKDKVITKEMVVAALYDWYYKMLATEQNKLSLILTNTTRNSTRWFLTSEKKQLYLENKAYLLNAKGFIVYDYQNNPFIKGKPNNELTTRINTYFTNTCTTDGCQYGITLKGSSEINTPDEVYAPIAIVFSNNIAKQNTDAVEIKKRQALNAIHELGHCWDMKTMENGSSTIFPCNTDDNLESHNYWCNGYGSNWCAFKYWSSTTSNLTSEEFYSKQYENREFCEGHRNVLINRLSIRGNDCE